MTCNPGLVVIDDRMILVDCHFLGFFVRYEVYFTVKESLLQLVSNVQSLI